MLTDDFPFLLAERAAGDVTATLRRLADDLERLCDDASPGVAELEAAPLIVGWRTVLSPVGLRLVGCPR